MNRRQLLTGVAASAVAAAIAPSRTDVTVALWRSLVGPVPVAGPGWHQVTVTRASDVIRMFVDGERRGVVADEHATLNEVMRWSIFRSEDEDRLIDEIVATAIDGGADPSGDWTLSWWEKRA